MIGLKEISAIVEDQSKLRSADLNEMIKLAEEYPYFSTLHILIAKKALLENDPRSRNLEEKAALYASSRVKLKQFLLAGVEEYSNGEMKGEVEKVEEVHQENQEPVSVVKEEVPVETVDEPEAEPVVEEQETSTDEGSDLRDEIKRIQEETKRKYKEQEEKLEEEERKRKAEAEERTRIRREKFGIEETKSQEQPVKEDIKEQEEVETKSEVEEAALIDLTTSSGIDEDDDTDTADHVDLQFIEGKEVEEDHDDKDIDYGEDPSFAEKLVEFDSEKIDEPAEVIDLTGEDEIEETSEPEQVIEVETKEAVTPQPAEQSKHVDEQGTDSFMGWLSRIQEVMLESLDTEPVKEGVTRSTNGKSDELTIAPFDEEYTRDLKHFTKSSGPKGVEASVLGTAEDEVNDDLVRDLAKASVEAHEIETETMAAVYAIQGKTEKAIAIYKKLSLNYPEKSAYFAQLIEKLKKT